MPTPKEFLMSKTRLIVASTLALAGVLAAGAAHAGRQADVQWSVTIGTPVGVPVYTVPAPVYSRSAPVYVQSQPLLRVVDPHRRSHRDQRYQEPTRWDRDGDGIPNRHDRLYNPRWDIDGDGVPNRRDRDRDGDGDGLPNWNDRHDNRHWRGR
jgi:hypothetical protein